MRRAMLLVAGALVVVASVVGRADAGSTFVLKSAAFSNGGTIPHKYSYDSYGCTGDDVSPQLSWSGAPKATKSFALTVFDPDANKGKGWWHWVLYGIPASTVSLVSGVKAAGTEGPTSFGKPGYGGPCPPPGDTPHHYVFTLYALDDSPAGALDGPHLDAAIKGHILAKAVLIGRFGR